MVPKVQKPMGGVYVYINPTQHTMACLSHFISLMLLSNVMSLSFYYVLLFVCGKVWDPRAYTIQFYYMLHGILCHYRNFFDDTSYE